MLREDPHCPPMAVAFHTPKNRLSATGNTVYVLHSDVDIVLAEVGVRDPDKVTLANANADTRGTVDCTVTRHDAT